MSTESWGHYRPNPLVMICMKVCNSRLITDGMRAKLHGFIEKRQSIYDISVDGIKYRWHVDDKRTRNFLLGAQCPSLEEFERERGSSADSELLDVTHARIARPCTVPDPEKHAAPAAIRCPPDRLAYTK